VSADYTGASADTVQKSVIVPIEEAINGVDGIDYISSSSTSSGSAYISVVFKSGIDPDMAVVMVKNRVAEVEGILPQEVVKTGVHVEKEQRSFLKVIALECPDNRYDNDFITNYFNINLSPRLQRIKGVSRIQLLGNVYAMRIWMDPKRMAEHDLSPSDIEEALNGQNIEAAIGTLGEDSKHTFQYTMVYRGRLINAEEFGNIVLKTLPDGGDLLLKDVARCELGTENYSSDGWVNSHNGTVAILTQAAGSNARQVNHEIDRLIEQVKPQAVQVELIATSYYQLEMLDAQIADTRAILESWEESIRVQKALMAVGEATSDEVAQAEASRLEAEKKLEELQRQVLQSEHALCAVLGRYGGHIVRSDFQTSIGQLNVVDSLPLRVLANRPDVRQAEAALKSAYYLTNVARAAFYPSLTIGGQVGFGYGAENDGTLTGLLTRVFGSLTMPVFAQGRLKADLKKAKAEQEEAQVAFHQTLVDASKEVNDILAGQHHARRTIALNEQQLEKLQHVLQVTETRMKYESEVNFLQVLLARQSLLEARLSLLDNRYDLVESVINLYRALGGSIFNL